MSSNMAAAEISSILQDIYDENLQFCAICLRTEQQRQIVESKYLEQCARKLKVRPPANKYLCFVCESHVVRTWRTLQAILFASTVNAWYHGHEDRARRGQDSKQSFEKYTMNKYLCFVCESHVVRTWRTLQAILFASTVNAWYHGHEDRARRGQDSKQSFEKYTMLLTFGEDNKPLGPYWEQVRARSALVRTEPLIVGSDPDQFNQVNFVDQQSSGTQTNPTLQQMVTKAPVLKRLEIPFPTHIQDAVQETTHEQPQISRSETSNEIREPEDNIVILDDDDPPPLPTLVPLDKLLENPTADYISLTDDRQQIISIQPNNPDCYTLYPVFEGIDNYLYVPYLNARIVNHQLEIINKDTLITNVKQKQQNNTDETSQKIIESEPHDISKKPEVQTVKIDKGSLDNIVEMCIKEVLGSKEKKQKRGKEREKEIKEGSGVGEGEGVSEVPKQAVMSADKVDWEDKIPMDVISFVDATDPNADIFLTPEKPPATKNRSSRSKIARMLADHDDSEVVIDLS